MTAGLLKMETRPRRGLLPFEWALMAYVVFTLLMTAFLWTRLPDPMALVWGRIRIVVFTLLMCGVYRLAPCRLVMFIRVALQMALLAWWYPDTYELNRVLPNLDHVFAGWEQVLFGCQPALLWAQNWSSPIVSELMDMGYASYYPMMVVVLVYYFFARPQEFEKAAFTILGAFFLFYVIFDLVPVTGPTFYYKAVGTDEIARGVFPALGDYFNTHTDCLPSPGMKGGFFYNLVEQAKDAGERPTAAFPSSHVGISTICMLLVWRAKSRRLAWLLAPFFLLLCLSTVYIQAHYAIDAIAGLFVGALFYFVLIRIK